MRRKISEEGGYAVLQPAGREINDWAIEGYQLWAFVIETAVPKLVQSIILFNSNESLVGPENVIEKLFENTKKKKKVFKRGWYLFVRLVRRRLNPPLWSSSTFGNGTATGTRQFRLWLLFRRSSYDPGTVDTIWLDPVITPEFECKVVVPRPCTAEGSSTLRSPAPPNSCQLSRKKSIS